MMKVDMIMVGLVMLVLFSARVTNKQTPTFWILLQVFILFLEISANMQDSKHTKFKKYETLFNIIWEIARSQLDLDLSGSPFEAFPQSSVNH